MKTSMPGLWTVGPIFRRLRPGDSILRSASAQTCPSLQRTILKHHRDLAGVIWEMVIRATVEEAAASEAEATMVAEEVVEVAVAAEVVAVDITVTVTMMVDQVAVGAGVVLLAVTAGVVAMPVVVAGDLAVIDQASKSNTLPTTADINEVVVEASVAAMIVIVVVMAAVATLIPALTEVDAVAIATRKCTVKTSHRHKVAEAHPLELGHAK